MTLTNVGLGVARQVVLHGLEAHQVTASEAVDLEYGMVLPVESIGSPNGSASPVVASPIWVTWEDGRRAQRADLDSLSGVWSYLAQGEAA